MNLQNSENFRYVKMNVRIFVSCMFQAVNCIVCNIIIHPQRLNSTPVLTSAFQKALFVVFCVPLIFECVSYIKMIFNRIMLCEIIIVIIVTFILIYIELLFCLLSSKLIVLHILGFRILLMYVLVHKASSSRTIGFDRYRQL